MKNINIKMIPYGRQWITKEDISAVVKVLKSDWITQGPQLAEFEQVVAQYCGAKYAVAVSSGTAALHIAALSAGIKQGDEVITSPMTFAASANCVLYCGGKPVFADIEEKTANIDPEQIEKKVNHKTKAIIPVDFMGHPCDLDRIFKIAKEHNLIVIEDAAHALGAKYKGKKIGGLSDMTILSFHPVKHITTGEGGAVLTNDKKLYSKLMLYRTHGITRDPEELEDNHGAWYYEMKVLGFNYRITDIQCALGISQLKRLDYFVKRRREIAELYSKSFGQIEELEIPFEGKKCASSYHLYVIKVKSKTRRARIFNALRKLGIGVNVHYIPVHLHPYYKKSFGYKKGDYPVAEDYYDRAISLPIYPKITNRDVKKVVNAVKSVL